MQVSWRVDGTRELNDALGNLSEKAVRRVLRRAVASGGRVFRDLMRANIHSVTGALAKDIVVSTDARNISSATASVKPRKQAYIANFLEFGTRPHQIKPRKKLALSLHGRGIAVASVRHPGIAPRPFMRPAADEGKEQAVEELKRVLQEAIQSEWKHSPRVQK